MLLQGLPVTDTSGRQIGVQVPMSYGINTVSCVFTNVLPQPGAVRVVKNLPGKTGTFTLSVTSTYSGTAGTATQPGAGDNSYVERTTDAGTQVSVNETADGGTDAARYNSSLTCTSSTGDTLVAPVAATSGTFTMPPAGVVCTFTNTLKDHPLTLRKALAPETDPGTFDLLVNGAVVKADAGNGGFGSTSVSVGRTVTVSETGNTGAYTTSLRCSGSGIDQTATGTSTSFEMPNGPVECIFTNTRKRNTVTLNKALVPTQDPGRFTLEINDAATATSSNIGHAGSTGAVTVDVGSAVAIRELAGVGTDLANYIPSLSCSSFEDTREVTESGFVMPDAPVTCTFTNTRRTNTLELHKVVSPSTDPGKFTLMVDGQSTERSSNVGSGGSTGTLLMPIGQQINLAELAGTDTDLADYSAQLTCLGVDGPIATVNGSLTMPAGHVDCTFTNTRKSAPTTVRVTKALLPIDDAGRFSLYVNDQSSAEAGNGGTTGAVQILPGTLVTVGERAAAGTSLDDYDSQLSCIGVDGVVGTTSASFTMPSGSVNCTITNTRKQPGTVTLYKVLSPADDPGRFTLRINQHETVKVGHRGTTGAVSVAAGTLVTLAELAADAETNLDNYRSQLTCVGVDGVTGSTSGSFTMPAGNVECTFTNTRKGTPPTLIVRKAVSPIDDPGRFTLQIDGASAPTSVDIGNGGFIGPIEIAAGTPVTVNELAGSNTRLADYDSQLVCTGIDGVNAATAEGSFTMPDGAVRCTFTNTRKPVVPPPPPSSNTVTPVPTNSAATLAALVLLMVGATARAARTRRRD